MLTGTLAALGPRVLLASAFVTLALFPGRCPVSHIPVYVVDRSFVVRLRNGNGIDLRRHLGTVRCFVLGDPGRQLLDAFLEFFGRVFARKSIDTSPLEVRVIPLVRNRIPVVLCYDAQVGKPLQVLPGCFRVTLGPFGNGVRSCRLAGLEDGTVDAL